MAFHPVQDLPVVPGAFPHSPSFSPPPDDGLLLVSSGSSACDPGTTSDKHQELCSQDTYATGCARSTESMLRKRQEGRWAPYSTAEGSRSATRSSDKSDSYSALGAAGLLDGIRSYIRRLSSNGPLTPVDPVEPVMSQKADDSLSRIIYDAATPDSPISPGFSAFPALGGQRSVERRPDNKAAPVEFASPSVVGLRQARHASLSALQLENDKITSLHGALPVRETRSLSEITPISSGMSMAEVAKRLGDHGLKDITDQLDQASCGSLPVSSGGYGDIYHCSLHDGSRVAIKTLRLQVSSSENGQKSLKHAAQELHTWSKCRHPNVINLLGLVQFRGGIGMVSAWAGHGHMRWYLDNYPQTDRCQLSVQISEGLAYLHENSIIHGDLKGENVLISNDGIPMIADFGNAVLHGSSLHVTGTTAKHSLSPRWTAPEVFQDSESCLYSSEADVYALGMTILEAITGKVPWAQKPDHVVVALISVKKVHPKRPEDSIPPDSYHGNILWGLLTHCWSTEPAVRPTAVDVANTMKKITHEGLTRSFGRTPG